MLQRIEITEGDDAYFDIPVEVDGVAVDITGWEFWLTLKPSPDDADAAAIAQLSTANGQIAIFNAAGGIARAHFLPADTTGKPGRYVCDVQAKHGITETIARPIITVLPQITRAT